MEGNFAPSFKRLFKKLNSTLQKNIRETAAKVIDVYVSEKKTPGLGIKHLRGSIWEARSGIQAVNHPLRNSGFPIVGSSADAVPRIYLRPVFNACHLEPDVTISVIRLSCQVHNNLILLSTGECFHFVAGNSGLDSH